MPLTTPRSATPFPFPFPLHASRLHSVFFLLLCVLLSPRPSHASLSTRVLSPAVRDMTATQLIGTYQNVPLPTPSSLISPPVCPDFFRVGLVELLQTDTAALYILPHRHLSLPIQGGGASQCVSVPITANDIVTESATILRRDDQQSLDRNNSLIKTFSDANERFFLGVEVGPRRCGASILPGGSVSMWVAPVREYWVRVPSWGYLVKFAPPRKYVVFFNANYPCVFAGDAAESGTVTEARSPTPSTTSTVSPTPSMSPSPSAAPSILPFVPSPFNPQDGRLPVSPVAPYRSTPVCFPAAARVLLLSPRSPIPVFALRPGMTVLVDHKSSPCKFLGFSHRDPNARSLMVRIHTSANQSLTVSPGHYVYVHRNGWLSTQAVRADSVRPGDRMLLASQESYLSKTSATATVVKIESRWETGLFNPQTTCGDIVVDGFRVTTYTTATGGIQAGHALLTPLRLINSVFDTDLIIDRICDFARSRTLLS